MRVAIILAFIAFLSLVQGGRILSFLKPFLKVKGSTEKNLKTTEPKIPLDIQPCWGLNPKHVEIIEKSNAEHAKKLMLVESDGTNSDFPQPAVCWGFEPWYAEMAEKENAEHQKKLEEELKKKEKKTKSKIPPEVQPCWGLDPKYVKMVEKSKAEHAKKLMLVESDSTNSGFPQPEVCWGFEPWYNEMIKKAYTEHQKKMEEELRKKKVKEAMLKVRRDIQPYWGLDPKHVEIIEKSNAEHAKKLMLVESDSTNSDPEPEASWGLEPKYLEWVRKMNEEFAKEQEEERRKKKN